MWSIIQLRDRDESPMFEEDDVKDGVIYDGFETKKEAIKEVKEKNWIQAIEMRLGFQNKKYRWIVTKENNI